MAVWSHVAQTDYPMQIIQAGVSVSAILQSRSDGRGLEPSDSNSRSRPGHRFRQGPGISTFLHCAGYPVTALAKLTDPDPIDGLGYRALLTTTPIRLGEF